MRPCANYSARIAFKVKLDWMATGASMITRTCLDLVGSDYGPGMVDITHLNAPSSGPA